MNLPFFDNFVAIFPVVVGTLVFIFSFYDKLYESWIKNFSEKSAKRYRMFFRYGGPVMVLLGAIIYFVNQKV